MSLFRSRKDIEFVKKINQELIEKVLGEKILYIPVSKKYSEASFYNEAEEKVFDPPIEIYALIEWLPQDITTTKYGHDIVSNLKVSILGKHLADINVKPYEGDFVEYDGVRFEISKIEIPSQIFGRAHEDIGYQLSCRSIREGVFETSLSASVDQQKRTYPDEPLSSSFYYSDVTFPFSSSSE